MVHCRQLQAAHFERNVAHSAANLFVRIVSDIHAMHSAYFADDSLWSGLEGTARWGGGRFGRLRGWD